MSLIRFLLLCFLINNNHHHRRKPLTSRSRDTTTNCFLFSELELRAASVCGVPYSEHKFTKAWMHFGCHVHSVAKRR